MRTWWCKTMWTYYFYFLQTWFRRLRNTHVYKIWNMYSSVFVQYANSEFWRDYVPLLVLFCRRKGMKRVCSRKRWGKCSRRCIVKFNFLAFIEWISTFHYVYLWVGIWNITSKEKYSKVCHDISIPCHFKVGLILK